MSFVEELVPHLPEWLGRRRWFGAKGREVSAVDVVSATSLTDTEPHGLQQPRRCRVVPQGVVGAQPADPPDGDVLELAPRLPAAAQQQLVVLHRPAVGERDGEHQQVEERFGVGQRRRGRHLDGADLAALRPEPPLPPQPLGQVRHELLDERHCCASSTGAAAPNRHIPHPTGADLAVRGPYGLRSVSAGVSENQ